MTDLRTQAIEAMARAQIIHTNGSDGDYDGRHSGLSLGGAPDG